MGNDSKQLMTRAIACGSALPSSPPHHAEAVPQAVLTGNIPQWPLRRDTFHSHPVSSWSVLSRQRQRMSPWCCIRVVLYTQSRKHMEKPTPERLFEGGPFEVLPFT